MTAIPPWLDTAIERVRHGATSAAATDFSHGGSVDPPGRVGRSYRGLSPATELDIRLGRIAPRRPRRER